MTNKVNVGGASKLWLPVPRDWDGNGQRNVKVVSIDPPPDRLYEDAYGNRIAFWSPTSKAARDYVVTFEIDLAPIPPHAVDPDKIGEYDKSSWEYQTFTQPSTNIQSNSESVVQLGRQIVSVETNPYLQAALIHQWMTANIKSGATAGNLLSVVDSRTCGDCYDWSVTFVGLLRSLGVPARLVAGYHNYRDGYFSPGLYEWPKEPFGIHVWIEFYLPNYGWLQIEPQNRALFGIGEERIVLSRGEDIELESGSPTIDHFHMPRVDYTRQQYGDHLSLEVVPLP